MSFAEFNLHPSILANVTSLGFEIPTTIQVQAIPVVVEGQDLLGIAKTGSGKTACFVLPILDQILKNTGITGNNGDTLFESVLKKMLPAASGTVYTKDWTMNEVKGLTETWTMSNVFDVDELVIIAFVQDNITSLYSQVQRKDKESTNPSPHLVDVDIT